MVEYLTKEELYERVHQCKNEIGLSTNEYGFAMPELCLEKKINLLYQSFHTKALRGMASIGSVPEHDVIILNSDRSHTEQNFDCCHEFMHLKIHCDLDDKIFNCINTLYIKQDDYIEWQANEGAAEMLMPYKEILSHVKMFYSNEKNPYNVFDVKDYLSIEFSVTGKVIEYRLESLRHELWQHANGVQVNDVEVLSACQRFKKGIKTPSLHEITRLYHESQARKQSNFINFGAIF